MAEERFDAVADARDEKIELVCAYVSNANNRITAEELQALIRDTFATVSSLQAPSSSAEPEAQANQQATKADIRKSIGAETITSFEDGKGYKSLKRHLTTRGMSPAEYRTKWGLPADYPMVHPDYSAKRSQLAKAIGLGAKGRSAKSGTSTPAKTRKPRTPKAAVAS